MVFTNVLNFSPLDQPYQNHNDGYDQKYVNKVAHRVAGNQSEQPEDD
jgi:hypothetical protein